MLTTLNLFSAPVAALLVLVLLVGWSSLDAGLAPWVWILLVPFLYLCWLMLFCILSALEVRIAAHWRPTAHRVPLEGPGSRLLTVRYLLLKYHRAYLLDSLPLVSALRNLPLFDKLFMRVYAPRSLVHPSAGIGGRLYDPDLTTVGPGTLIGGLSTVLAHGMVPTEDGGVAYVWAPIRIGGKVTIGGACVVSMGTVIGDGAVLEQGSMLPAFVRVPPAEVWGGNPARFLRSAQLEKTAAGSTEHALFTPSVEYEPVRRLVAEALQLGPEWEGRTPSAQSCSQWDSLGQVAIAAAVANRFAVALQPEQVFALRSVDDIVRHLQQQTTASSATGSGVAGDDLLPTDPELLPLLDRERATQWLASVGDQWPVPRQTVRILVAATYTAEPLQHALCLWCRPFGLDPEVVFAGYDQVVQTLLDPPGDVVNRPGNVLVVLPRLQDLGLADESSCRLRVAELLEALEACARRPARAAVLMAATLPAVPPLPGETAGPKWVESLRLEWDRTLSAVPGVRRLDVARLLEECGLRNAEAPANDTVWRAPYRFEIFRELGIELARAIRAVYLPPAKVLALDCDDTLWGGAAAEEGLAVQVGPDGPGRPFLMFQQAVLRLKARGMLLALVSRNEEADVWRILEQHPDMALRRKDIAAACIGWGPKSAGLGEIAKELGVGLDSVVFVDNDPIERAEVMANCAQVTVLPLPRDPAEYGPSLGKLWVFDGVGATEEDQARARYILDEQRRSARRQAAPTLAEYLKSLEIEADVDPPDDHELSRIVQLTQKTNQFNLSLKRRTIEQIGTLTHHGGRIWRLRARDRFGDYGLVGVCIVHTDENRGKDWLLDTFLLSCRALGRQLEHAFLHAVAVAAVAAGAARMLAPFVAGPRNAPVLTFLREVGFREDGNGQWVRDLDPIVPLPSHVRLRNLEFPGK